MLMSKSGDIDFAEARIAHKVHLILFAGIGVLMLAISTIAAVFTVRSLSRG
jgi:hypothetical protein